MIGTCYYIFSRAGIMLLSTRDKIEFYCPKDINKITIFFSNAQSNSMYFWEHSRPAGSRVFKLIVKTSHTGLAKSFSLQILMPSLFVSAASSTSSDPQCCLVQGPCLQTNSQPIIFSKSPFLNTTGSFSSAFFQPLRCHGKLHLG